MRLPRPGWTLTSLRSGSALASQRLPIPGIYTVLFISESCSKELTRTGGPKEWLAKRVGFTINIETININIETAASVHACLQLSQEHPSNQESLLGSAH